MKIFIFGIGLALATSVAFADSSVVAVDLKLLCEINKVEKSLSKDKSISAPDLAQRIYSMKEHGFQDAASKKALQSISQMAERERSQSWKQFAKEHGIKDTNCL